MSESNADLQIELSNFSLTVARLKEALEAFAESPENLFILDSVVKRFELTYELSMRSLRRYLIDFSINEVEVGDLSFKDLLRVAEKHNLIQDPAVWLDVRGARNRTVHSYKEAIARRIAALAGDFVKTADTLLQTLRERTEQNG